MFPAPKKVDALEFGKDEFGHLIEYIGEQVKHLKAKTRGIREELMPKWVRTYRGIPAEETKTWPWPGASNLVIQIVATFSDELLSRVMALFANDPLYVAKLLGDFDEDTDASGNDQRQILEEFLQDCAYEPDELDLYRVEETGFSSAIRYGTGIFKFPWEYVVEQQATYIAGGSEEGGKVTYKWDDLVKHDGPHPETVPLSDFGIDPRWPNLNQADFKFHTLHLSRRQLRDKQRFPEIFDAAVIDRILQSPDKQFEYQRQLEEQKKADIYPEKVSETFAIEECWFTYDKDGKRFRLVAYYHLGTELVLGVIYNAYPDNIEPFEDAKLAYDDDTYFGYGFCEMLESYQREISTTHNWRMDNRHFATTGVGRVNKNSKLASILQLYPGALVPADDGEIEALEFGKGAVQYGTEDEQWTEQLATRRAGVDPSVGGSGGGTVNKKGQFSAQGTAITLQAQNNRNNLRSSDMRASHVRMGRKIAKMYAYFGIGKKLRQYGDRAELLQKALDSYKSKKLGLVIKPATASQNKELEKQNDILLSATLERLYAGDAQIIQAISTPGMPQELMQYYVETLKAKNALMSDILRNFGRSDVKRLIPVPSFLKSDRQRVMTGAEQNGQQNSGARGNGVPPQTSQQPGQNPGMVPIGAGATNGTVPQ
jgi:hypothetical protein